MLQSSIEQRDISLRLRGMGSFHIGGKVVELTDGEPRQVQLTRTGRPATIDPNGSYVVGQMYVQYFLPDPAVQKFPLLFWHGGGLTGACWETTPDGRPGFRDIFLRAGWDVYVSDAVERGRAGFAPIPDVWEPPISQTIETVFERFRFGKYLPNGKTFCAQDYAFNKIAFPMNSIEQFAAQMVPRWTQTDDLIIEAYLEELRKVGPGVIIAHSQGCVFALEAAARHPELVSALVLLEPAAISHVATLATEWPVPTLIVLGDLIEKNARWIRMREDIRNFAGNFPSVEIMSLPERGIYGNSHMLMMDTNSADVAAVIQTWLEGLPV
ncbi:alpha/beta fold hydrolase [Thalassospira sp.]|uniref:alpha/beta fold hydrolase n=1 Tax=Thalassospira sp. TaxID=1912094 RepID=UPI003AA843ED